MLRLILADWAKCAANVTITLRGGVQLSGTVRAWRGGADPGLVQLDAEAPYDGLSRKQVRHDIRLTEIASVSAVPK